MPLRIAASLSMHTTSMPSSLPRSAMAGVRRGSCSGNVDASGTSIEKCEPRSTVEWTSTL
jgi:hypothetical protein